MADPIALATAYGQRISNNLRGTFENMTPEKWIRLVIIVGAYLLLRPYMMKLAGRNQLEQHVEEEQRAEEEHKARLSANSLRGHVEIPDDSDDDADAGADASATGPEWGKKARRRQRALIKKILTEHEKRLEEEQADEEDKDIEEFLLKD